MHEKTKILFVAQNLYVGGVQKAFVNLLNKAEKSGKYDISVFTFAKGALEAEVPHNIPIRVGNKILRLSATPLRSIKATGNVIDIAIRIFVTVLAKIIGSERFYRLVFRKQAEKYDIAVSYFTDVPIGVFNKGTNLYVSDFANADKKIAWIHTDPILSGFDKEYCRRIYKPFDKIICVSDAVRQKFNELLPEYSNKTETRHNVFDEEKIKKLAIECEPFKKSRFDIVTVARVDNASKRIDGILNMCRRLKDNDISDFCWRIIGDGPDLNRNIELANELGVDDVVIFEGEKLNPYPYIYKSDLFALYSAYEGFPLVIGEALILKTPILTTNYAAAREQILPDGGTIADSDEIFFEYLKDYIIGNN
ncbi:MAG: glycosyltransferase [Clostridia bacterium]|nr:glycosyltransferase [Clostridia bacterium]